MERQFSTAALALAAAGIGLAATPVLRVPKVTTPPTLDDFATGEPRTASARVTGFRQYQPGDGQPVTEPTAAYLSYDAANLYVVFVCKDEPGEVRARLSKRDDIESDDHVVLNLDTFHDHQRAYTFRANPLGVQDDAMFTEGQGADPHFDAVWRSEGRLTADGYVVLMAIPFRNLRFPEAAVHTWGIGLGRSIARKNEYATWPYITRRTESYLAQLADLEGLEEIPQGRNLDLIPYGMFARARSLDSLRPGFRVDTDTRAGLDAKLILRNALAIDVALNPDFSQVESDDPQVTVNQRYEVFFPEKRPFFIESAGFFSTPIESEGFTEPALRLFFSRRIVDPRFGARLTGKFGGWVVGALAVDDRSAGRVSPDDPGGRGAAMVGVFRVRRDFAAQSSVGVLVTSRDFEGSSNRVFSADARLRLTPNWVFSAQLLRSDSREPGGTRLSGPGYYARLDNTGRRFRYFGRYLDLSPGFRSELGFIRRTGFRESEHWAEYKWRPEGRRVLSFGPSAAALINWDRLGRVQDWTAGAGFDVELPRQTRFSAGRSNSYELFRGTGFRKDSAGASFSTEWLKWFAVHAYYTFGRSVNYYPAPVLPPFAAKSIDAQVGFTLRPGARLAITETYLYTRLSTTQRQPILNDHTSRFKINYQFTRPLSLRAIIDYHAVLPNASFTALERTKRVTADFLLAWLVHPGTALYLGYTDHRENLAFADSPPWLRRTGSPGMSTGRQVFLKVSYRLGF